MQKKYNFIFISLALYSFVSGQDRSKKVNLDEDQDFIIAKKQQLLIQELRQKEFEDILKKVTLSVPDTTSLIVLNSINEQLLSAKEWNNNLRQGFYRNWVQYLEMQSDTKPDINVDSIRTNMLFTIYENKYMEDKWNKIKEDREFNDSLQKFIMNSKQSEYKIENDTISLLKYDYYYNYLFAPSNQSIFSIITSTDSLLLDSLIKNISERKIDNSSTKTDCYTPILKKQFSVNIIQYDSLPQDLRSIADSIKLNNWSKITKCKWGYFVLGLNQKKIKKENKLRDVHRELMLLPDSSFVQMFLSDDNIKNYFEKNSWRFQKDTGSLSIKISPNVFVKKTGVDSPLVIPDIKIPDIKCSIHELPVNILCLIFNDSTFIRTDTTEWFQNKYGIWKIKRINKSIRKTCPISECKSEIIKLLKFEIINRRYEKSKLAIIEKDKDQSIRFFTNFYYRNSLGKLTNGESNFNYVQEINNWAKQNISIYF
jgi:hypothetical protein